MIGFEGSFSNPGVFSFNLVLLSKDTHPSPPTARSVALLR